jgi:ABC-type polysaccharide/polyol phosphate export permease
MANEVKVNFGGTGVLLTIVFFAAKIFGYISWSWWWVFAPIWLPFCLVLAFTLFVAILETL